MPPPILPLVWANLTSLEYRYELAARGVAEKILSSIEPMAWRDVEHYYTALNKLNKIELELLGDPSRMFHSNENDATTNTIVATKDLFIGPLHGSGLIDDPTVAYAIGQLEELSKRTTNYPKNFLRIQQSQFFTQCLEDVQSIVIVLLCLKTALCYIIAAYSFFVQPKTATLGTPPFNPLKNNYAQPGQFPTLLHLYDGVQGMLDAQLDLAAIQPDQIYTCLRTMEVTWPDQLPIITDPENHISTDLHWTIQRCIIKWVQYIHINNFNSTLPSDGFEFTGAPTGGVITVDDSTAAKRIHDSIQAERTRVLEHERTVLAIDDRDMADNPPQFAEGRMSQFRRLISASYIWNYVKDKLSTPLPPAPAPDLASAQTAKVSEFIDKRYNAVLNEGSKQLGVSVDILKAKIDGTEFSLVVLWQQLDELFGDVHQKLREHITRKVRLPVVHQSYKWSETLDKLHTDLRQGKLEMLTAALIFEDEIRKKKQELIASYIQARAAGNSIQIPEPTDAELNIKAVEILLKNQKLQDAYSHSCAKLCSIYLAYLLLRCVEHYFDEILPNAAQPAAPSAPLKTFMKISPSATFDARLQEIAKGCSWFSQYADAIVSTGRDKFIPFAKALFARAPHTHVDNDPIATSAANLKQAIDADFEHLKVDERYNKQLQFLEKLAAANVAIKLNDIIPTRQAIELNIRTLDPDVAVAMFSMGVNEVKTTVDALLRKNDASVWTTVRRTALPNMRQLVYCATLAAFREVGGVMVHNQMALALCAYTFSNSGCGLQLLASRRADGNPNAVLDRDERALNNAMQQNPGLIRGLAATRFLSMLSLTGLLDMYYQTYMVFFPDTYIAHPANLSPVEFHARARSIIHADEHRREFFFRMLTDIGITYLLRNVSRFIGGAIQNLIPNAPAGILSTLMTNIVSTAYNYGSDVLQYASNGIQYVGSLSSDVIAGGLSWVMNVALTTLGSIIYNHPYLAIAAAGSVIAGLLWTFYGPIGTAVSVVFGSVVPTKLHPDGLIGALGRALPSSTSAMKFFILSLVAWQSFNLFHLALD